jgi:hypothetical protein
MAVELVNELLKTLNKNMSALRKDHLEKNIKNKHLKV